MDDLIEKLAHMMADEIEGSAKYAKCAVKLKADHPKLAEMFHTMSKQEMEHMNHLQDAITSQLKALQDKYEQE